MSPENETAAPAAVGSKMESVAIPSDATIIVPVRNVVLFPGVIAPINPYIRLITGIENMIGIFYLAVVVSRLVSSYRPRNRQQRHRSADEPIE